MVVMKLYYRSFSCNRNNNNNNYNNAIISGFIDKTRVAAAFAPAAEGVFYPLPLPPPVPIR